jgi:hypothetical protein
VTSWLEIGVYVVVFAILLKKAHGVGTHGQNLDVAIPGSHDNSVYETAGKASSPIGGIDDGVFNDPDISIKGVGTVPYFLVSIVSCGTVIIFFKAYTDAIVHAVLLSLSNVSKCFTA